MTEPDSPGVLVLTYCDGNVSEIEIVKTDEVWPFDTSPQWRTSQSGITLTWPDGRIRFHPWHQIQHLMFNPA